MNTLLWILLSHCFILINADCNNHFIGAGEASKNAVVGENVILPCYNVIKQTNCTNTTWLSVEKGVTVELVKLGKIEQNSERAKRMSLTSNCSLHIRNVRAEDCECYICQQWNKTDVEVAKNHRWCLSVTKGKTTTKDKGPTTTKDKGPTTTKEKETTTTKKKGKTTTKDKGTKTKKEKGTKTKKEKGPTTTAKKGPTTTEKSVTTNTKEKETTTAVKSDSKIVIPSVLVIAALLVTTLTVWLIYRRRAHKRASVVNQNNVSTEHNGEDVTYIELKHNTVKPSKVDTVIEDKETVYSGIKLA